MNYRSSYSQKLLDPRWQKKRLEVMQENEFSCEICGDTESTLHIHHKQYLKGNEPWDYLVQQLACLCESCHEGTHQLPDILSHVCSFLPIDGKNSRLEIAILISGILGKGISKSFTNYEKAIYQIGELIDTNNAIKILDILKGVQNGKN